MLVIVPLITCTLATIAIRRAFFASDRLDDLFRSILLAFIFGGTYLVLSSELLSPFSLLSFGPVLFVWTAPALGLGWILPKLDPAPKVRWPQLDTFERTVVLAVTGIATVTGLVAYISAPNTFDGMSYHLPRVMHWAQSSTLSHFATHEPRQLFQGPGAELVALHQFLLSGSDRFGLVQWGAMAACLPAVAVIAGALGAGWPGRVLAISIAATIPMGLLQAVSTQTDYAVAFPLLTTYAFALSLARHPSPAAVVGVGCAAGLAVLIKPTAYFFLAALLLWLVWRLVRRSGRLAWRPVLGIAVLFLIINAGHYSRNFKLLGTPLNPTELGEYHRYRNDSVTPSTLVSNLLRNSAIHLGLPARGLDAGTYNLIRRAHNVLGLDVDDSGTTWPGMSFEPAPVPIHEDFSGNLIHFLAILVSLAVVTTSRSVRRRFPPLAPYAICFFVGALLFAALLKWSPWHSRLHLPLFLLAAPILGVLVERLPHQVRVVTVVLLLAQATPFLFFNPLHPLLADNNLFTTSRHQQTFFARPVLGEKLDRVTRRLAASECKKVGLVLPPDSWEYPLWTMLATPSSVRIENVGTDHFGRLEDPDFDPCAVFCLRCPEHQRENWTRALGEPTMALAPDHHHHPEALLFLRE